MSDPFFTQESCDRCCESLERSRKMSWFNTDCLCILCQEKEDTLKKQLSKNGYDVSKLEGCGYIPKENAKDFIVKE